MADRIWLEFGMRIPGPVEIDWEASLCLLHLRKAVVRFWPDLTGCNPQQILALSGFEFRLHDYLPVKLFNESLNLQLCMIRYLSLSFKKREMTKKGKKRKRKKTKQRFVDASAIV